MRYHINGELKVMPCSASTMSACPFYGLNDDSTNHYDDFDEAVLSMEGLLYKRYSVGHVEKPKNNFDLRESMIRSAWSIAGMTDDLPTVRNNSEMLSKWFAGDRDHFNNVVGIIENDELLFESKCSLLAMNFRDFRTDLVSNVDDMKNFTDASSALNVSEITVFDESDVDLDLDNLGSWRLSR